MDNSDRGKTPPFFKDSPKPNSLLFKWLHLNISFSVHFQTWAINHPYEHNGLCLWQFIIWIVSPVQVCINLCLKLEFRLAEIFPPICISRAVAPQDCCAQPRPGKNRYNSSFSGRRKTPGESKLRPKGTPQFTCPVFSCSLSSEGTYYEMFDDSSPNRRNTHATCVTVFAAQRKDENLKRSGMERYEAHKGESQSGCWEQGALVSLPTVHPLGQVISSFWASQFSQQ